MGVQVHLVPGPDLHTCQLTSETHYLGTIETEHYARSIVNLEDVIVERGLSSNAIRMLDMMPSTNTLRIFIAASKRAI